MTGRGLLSRLVFAVVVAVVVNLVLTLTTLQHDWVGVTLIVLCLAALVEAVASTMGTARPAVWRHVRATEETTPPSEGTLARYRRLLERQRVSRDPDAELQRQLLVLAERRLEQEHGLRRATDPEEVQLRLGPLETQLMTTRRLSASQVNRIIDRIEEL